MKVKIEQSINRITIGSKVIDLTLEEMNELYKALRKALGKPLPGIPITYPPYKPTIIEDGPLNPEKPWRDEPIPKRFPRRNEHWLGGNPEFICGMGGQLK